MNRFIITETDILAYACFLRNQEKCDSTIQEYLRCVRRYAAWLNGMDVTKEKVCQWKKHLLETGYAAVTVNRSLAAIHGFLAHMGWTHCRVSYLKVQRKIFRDASRELNRYESPVGRCAHGTAGKTKIIGGFYDVSDEWFDQLGNNGLVVEGGAFDAPVPDEYLAEGALVVSERISDTETIYYVNGTAEEAVNTAAPWTVLTVEQGSIEYQGTTYTAGMELTISAPAAPATSSMPKTGDDTPILLCTVLALLAAAGLFLLRKNGKANV